MYPLKFEPILKSVIWGGSKLSSFKGIIPVQSGIGESWEVSTIPNNVSTVSNGSLKGKTLNELIDTYGEALLGKEVVNRFGNNFPLLIKFIDAKEPLSIQVHPNDELAKKRHDSFGKTEMWYVIQADKGAYLFSGFQKEMTPGEYVKSLHDNSFSDYLAKYEVQPGDVFFLPAGRVHAIGSGCLIAEIQQNSNITYRIYDYNRKDAQGNSRELHTDLAKDAIDYHVYDDYRVTYPHKEGETLLVSSPYFRVNLFETVKENDYSLYQSASFRILMCLEGEGLLTENNQNKTILQQGETILIPASIQEIELHLKENSKLLDITIQ